MPVHILGTLDVPFQTDSLFGDILAPQGFSPDQWIHTPGVGAALNKGSGVILLTFDHDIVIEEALQEARSAGIDCIGSGIYARFRFLLKYPFYGNYWKDLPERRSRCEGEIIFAGDPNSQFTYTLAPHNDIYVPTAWHDYGTAGPCAMARIASTAKAGRVFAFGVP